MKHFFYKVFKKSLHFCFSQKKKCTKFFIQISELKQLLPKNTYVASLTL